MFSQPMLFAHQGSSILGALIVSTSTCPSLLSSSLASAPCTSPLLTLLANVLHPNFPSPQSNPTPAPPTMPVGASTNAAPDATDPIAVPATAAVRAPTAAYFAYRTRRQKRNFRV
ncbi:hypothetical protein KCU62_g6930, partial [Aureobasidium sp. EXF-3399]